MDEDLDLVVLVFGQSFESQVDVLHAEDLYILDDMAH